MNDHDPRARAPARRVAAAPPIDPPRRGEGWGSMSATGDKRTTRGADRAVPRRLHDLGRGRARGDAPPDPADVRAARTDQPKRSPKNTRLYSQADVERLRRIQRMTPRRGSTSPESRPSSSSKPAPGDARARSRRFASRRRSLKADAREVETVHRSLRAEIVPYGAYETAEIVPPGEAGGGAASRSNGRADLVP